MKLFRRLWKDEEGQGLVEYALIIALISIVIIVFGPKIYDQINLLFGKIKDKIKAANDSIT